VIYVICLVVYANIVTVSAFSRPFVLLGKKNKTRAEETSFYRSNCTVKHG